MEEQPLPYEGSYGASGQEDDDGLRIRLSSRICRTYSLKPGDSLDVYVDHENDVALVDLMGDSDD